MALLNLKHGVVRETCRDNLRVVPKCKLLKYVNQIRLHDYTKISEMFILLIDNFPFREELF